MAVCNISVNVDMASPEIKDIFNQLTVEDKREIATKVAFDFFKTQMTTTNNNSYYHHNTDFAERFLKEATTQLRGHIGDVLVSDPELKKKIDHIVSQLASNSQAFIQEAVNKALGSMIGKALISIQENQENTQVLAQRISFVEDTVRA